MSRIRIMTPLLFCFSHISVEDLSLQAINMKQLPHKILPTSAFGSFEG